MSDAAMPPGWYHGDGDPVGTKRYWDGNGWVGEPQVMMSDATDAPVAGGTTTAAGRTLSSAWKRIGARIIDAIILGVIGLVIAVVFGASTSSGGFDTSGAGLVAGLGAAIVGFLWDALFVAKMGGTPGKLMLGMQVIDAASGQTPPADPAGWKRAANRLLGIVPFLGPIVALVIGIVSLVFLFTDDNRQTVMDRFASTMVIDK